MNYPLPLSPCAMGTHEAKLDQMRPLVISLGAWCRPAYHIRNYFGYDRAFPHDWNITSYNALIHTLADGYDPGAEVMLPNSVMNQFESATDLASGVIYQHDLHRDQIEVEGVRLADTASNRAILKQVRSKAQALHRRLKETATTNPVIFVRWIRYGHPDGEWNEAFDGEIAEELYATLLHYCGHDRVKLLHVVSGQRGEETPLCVFTSTNFGATAVLYERPETDWTGDPEPWNAMFERVEQEWSEL